MDLWGYHLAGGGYWLSGDVWFEMSRGKAEGVHSCWSGGQGGFCLCLVFGWWLAVAVEARLLFSYDVGRSGDLDFAVFTLYGLRLKHYFFFFNCDFLF